MRLAVVLAAAALLGCAPVQTEYLGRGRVTGCVDAVSGQREGRIDFEWSDGTMSQMTTWQTPLPTCETFARGGTWDITRQGNGHIVFRRVLTAEAPERVQ